MPSVDRFKRCVRAAIPRSGFDLTYGQHIEVASLLVFGAKSWNHFCADPGNHSDALPQDVGQILARLQTAERFLPGLATPRSNSALPCRLRAWQPISAFWLDCLGKVVPAQSAFFCLFPNVETRVEIETLDDLEDSYPYNFFIRDLFIEWFTDHYQGGDRFADQIWEQFQFLAAQNGWSREDAGFYRELCMLSHFDGWSLASMVQLGLFDRPLGSGISINLLRNAGGRAVLDRIYALETPRGSVSW